MKHAFARLASFSRLANWLKVRRRKALERTRTGCALLTLEGLFCAVATRVQRRTIVDVMDVRRLPCAEAETMWLGGFAVARFATFSNMLVVVRGAALEALFIGKVS